MITVTIQYACGGCRRAETINAGLIQREFVSLNGKGYGFGKWVTPTVDFEAHAPDGWLAFDPYTQCTYCPDCWDSIVNDGE